MRTWLWTGLLGALAVAEGAAAVPRGLPSYPFCPAYYAANSLGAFPGGDVTIDTTNGSVNGGPASGVGVNNGLSSTRVLVFDSISIADGTTVTVTGDAGLALLSLGDLTVAGAILANGASSPSLFSTEAVPGGPGGGAGGRDPAGGAGGGSEGGTQSVDPENSSAGGGGGGHAGAGGDGGRRNIAPDAVPGTGGDTYGDLLGQLLGGSGGGAGAGPAEFRTSGAGGGGAVFLGALGAISVAGTGRIEANGGNGAGASTGAAGGGSGGAIVLFGQSVETLGELSAEGGDGGQGGCCGGGGGGGGGRILIDSAGGISGTGFLSTEGGAAGPSSGTAAEPGGAGTIVLESDGTGGLDTCSATQPFVCYKAKPTRASTPFTPRNDTIEDQLQSGTADVTKPAALCAPGLGGATTFEEDYFESYASKPDEKHVKQSGLAVATPFGTLSVDTVKPDRLLVPAAASESAAPPALPFAHFDTLRCYKAKLAKGSPKLAKGLTVDVEDPFSEGNRTLSVKKLSRLCVPASRNGSPIANEDRLLACFAAVPAKGEPKHVKRSGVFATQAFGTEQLDTLKEEEYCAPASIAPI